MIYFLHGKVHELTPTFAVLDVQGVGFEVFISKTLLPDLEIGRIITLQIHMVVREDLMALYGFENWIFRGRHENAFVLFARKSLV